MRAKKKPGNSTKEKKEKTGEKRKRKGRTDSTSMSALSDSTTTTASPLVTLSPGFFSHETTYDELMREREEEEEREREREVRRKERERKKGRGRAPFPRSLSGRQRSRRRRPAIGEQDWIETLVLFAASFFSRSSLFPGSPLKHLPRPVAPEGAANAAPVQGEKEGGESLLPLFLARRCSLLARNERARRGRRRRRGKKRTVNLASLARPLRERPPSFLPAAPIGTDRTHLALRHRGRERRHDDLLDGAGLDTAAASGSGNRRARGGGDDGSSGGGAGRRGGRGRGASDGRMHSCGLSEGVGKHSGSGAWKRGEGSEMNGEEERKF